MNTTTAKIMDALGLEPKRTTTNVVLTGVGIFAAGLLVGAGLGLLFAPKSGADLRREVSEKVANAKRRAQRAAEEAEEDVAHH